VNRERMVKVILSSVYMKAIGRYALVTVSGSL